MVEFELFVDALQLLGVEIGVSSGVMGSEISDVEDVVVEDEQSEFVFLGVVLDLLLVVEKQGSGRSLHLNL